MRPRKDCLNVTFKVKMENVRGSPFSHRGTEMCNRGDYIIDYLIVNVIVKKIGRDNRNFYNYIPD